MSWRVHVATNFMRDELDVHIAYQSTKGLAVVQPIDLVLEDTDGATITPPALGISRDLARALYDGLGQALGIHTPDARMAVEVLAREQDRVDKMLDHLTHDSDNS